MQNRNLEAIEHRILIVKLASIFAIFGFHGCSNDVASGPQTEVLTVEDYNRMYREGCDLISPYMQLHGVKSTSATTAIARDQLNRGISLLQKVVEIDPENWSAYWVMGKGYQALRKSNDACNAFAKSFAIQKDNPDVTREFMIECLNLGRASDAIDAAKHGVSLNPDNAGLLANLALAYLVGGKIDDAVSTVNKSLEIAPDDDITQNLKRIITEVQSGNRAQPKSTLDL